MKAQHQWALALGILALILGITSVVQERWSEWVDPTISLSESLSRTLFAILLGTLAIAAAAAAALLAAWGHFKGRGE